MSDPTFAECFCSKNNIPREKFVRTVFNRSLYRRAYLIRWLLPLIHPNHFAADFDLIYGVENLRRVRDFVLEAERFNGHPANHGWLRRTFCLRVSTCRLKALIRETLPRRSHSKAYVPSVEELLVEAEDHTAVPFGMGTTHGV
jgi:hypothetical protein